jgi:hypothetical protein
VRRGAASAGGYIAHRPERSRIILIDDPPKLIHRSPQQQQIAASSQPASCETACGSSSKSSISWGIIDENRQDGVYYAIRWDAVVTNSWPQDAA